jgi:hypothetical protein
VSEVYDYRDAAGGYLFSVLVERTPDGVKRVLQGVRQEDGGYVWSLNGVSERPLYRLPELVEHLRAGSREPIYVVEGEKDVEALRSRGLTATTNPMGAGKWRREHTETLMGARLVLIVADRDGPGRDHARAVQAALAPVVDVVELREPPADLGDHADISDLLAAGRDLAELEPLPHLAAATGDGPVEDTDEAEPHSWMPVDLVRDEGSSAGTPPPSIGGLLYAGKRHVLAGEPDAGKTWVSAAMCVIEAEKGNVAVYIDADGNGRDVIYERLSALGLTDKQIKRHIRYIEPSEPMLDPRILEDVDRLLDHEPPVTLIVGDSFDALLHLHGLDPNLTVDVEHFYRDVVGRWRARGAAVLLLDHVVKNREQRGRFAIGSQRKTGRAEVALALELVTPFSRSSRGVSRIVTHKDRPGHLTRPKLGELELTSDESGRVTWTIRPAGTQEGVAFRPTFLMERVSRHVEAHVAEEELSRTQVEKEVKGKGSGIRRALDVLIEEGYIKEREGSRNARLVTSLKPYRQEEDEAAR